MMFSHSVWLLLQLLYTLTLICPSSCQEDPVQFYEEDITYGAAEKNILHQIQTESQLRTRTCRIDYCPETTTKNPEKGDFTWSETTAGKILYVRCPYSMRTPEYAYRECRLQSSTGDNTVVSKHLYMEWNATWNTANTSQCPIPPMGQLLKRLNQELGQGSTWNAYLWALRDISGVIRQYGDSPVKYRDVIDMMLILYKAVTEGVQQGRLLPAQILKDAFSICDFLLGHDKELFSVQPLETIRLWLLEILGLLTEMHFPPGDELESYLRGKYLTIAATVTSGAGERIPFTLPSAISNDTIPLDITLSVLEPGDYVTHVMYLGHTAIVDHQVNIISYEQNKITTDVSYLMLTTPVNSGRTITGASAGVSQYATSRNNEITTPSSGFHDNTLSNQDDLATTPDSEGSQDTTLNIGSTEFIQSGGIPEHAQSGANDQSRSSSPPRSGSKEFTTPFSDMQEETRSSWDYRATRPNSQDGQDTTPNNLYDTNTMTDSDDATTMKNTATRITPQRIGEYTSPMGDTTEQQEDASVTPGNGRKKRDVRGTKVYLPLSTPLDMVSGIGYASVSQRLSLSGFTPSWDNLPPRVKIVISAKSKTLSRIPGTESSTKCTNINTRDEFRRTGFSMDTWYINPFECNDIIERTDTVVCVCSSLGFFTIMGMKDYSEPRIRQATVPPVSAQQQTQPKPVTEYSVFQYRHGVVMTSQGLRGACLILLIFTVVSFGMFRQASRGPSTHILIHLCVSLITLLIVFYVAEAVADTTKGCRVISALRYYLVLVSLLWSAAETLHLYLSLIEVFLSHFVLAAAFVAWGVPLVAVGIAFGVNMQSYDGLYDDQCIFRCMLNNDMAYYAYSLPMAAIFIHNIILYCFVIKILLQQEETISRDKGWADWARLVGSFTMTVLLAVPWLFSAFAIIDDGNANVDIDITQGVYQLVLAVFIMLQGVFIVTFYCGNNPDMRSRWRATFVPRGSVTASPLKEGIEMENGEKETYTTRDTEPQQATDNNLGDVQ